MRAFLLIAGCLLAGVPLAHADDVNDAFAQRLFSGVPAKPKAYACFVRVYDTDHLAKHPYQTVNAMKLLMTSEVDSETSQPNLSFRLGLTYRSRSGAFDSSGDCMHATNEQGRTEPRTHCSVDCDGGGVDIGLTPDNKSAMLSVEQVRIWRNNEPDGEASHSLVGGKDDKIFRLDRADLKECSSLVTDRKELAEIRSVSHRH